MGCESLALDRDHFVYAPSQWQTTSQCNVAAHWLGTHTKWSLHSADYLGTITQVIMKDTDEIILDPSRTKHNKARTVCKILGMYPASPSTDK